MGEAAAATAAKIAAAESSGLCGLSVGMTTAPGEEAGEAAIPDDDQVCTPGLGEVGTNGTSEGKASVPPSSSAPPATPLPPVAATAVMLARFSFLTGRSSSWLGGGPKRFRSPPAAAEPIACVPPATAPAGTPSSAGAAAAASAPNCSIAVEVLREE